MNSLLSNIIADDVNKSDDQNLEKKGLEQLFKFMDERKTKIKSGSSQFTPSEMKKMMSHLDFMVKMSTEKRHKFADRLRELLDSFEASTSGIVKETQDKIKLLKSYINEID